MFDACSSSTVVSKQKSIWVCPDMRHHENPMVHPCSHSNCQGIFHSSKPPRTLLKVTRISWIHLPEKSWLLGDPKIDNFKANTITNHFTSLQKHPEENLSFYWFFVQPWDFLKNLPIWRFLISTACCGHRLREEISSSQAQQWRGGRTVSNAIPCGSGIRRIRPLRPFFASPHGWYLILKPTKWGPLDS